MEKIKKDDKFDFFFSLVPCADSWSDQASALAAIEDLKRFGFGGNGVGYFPSPGC